MQLDLDGVALCLSDIRRAEANIKTVRTETLEMRSRKTAPPTVGRSSSFRGFGPTRFLSGPTIRSGQQAALGRDLIGLLDGLRIEAAIVAGFDWGGLGLVRRNRPMAKRRRGPHAARQLRCRRRGSARPRVLTTPRIPIVILHLF
jgi:hypothetical protein